jgi:hypothetical protein
MASGSSFVNTCNYVAVGYKAAHCITTSNNGNSVVLGACAGAQRSGGGSCQQVLIGFCAGGGALGAGVHSCNSVVIGNSAGSYGNQLSFTTVIGHCAMCGYRDTNSDMVTIGHGAARCIQCCLRCSVVIGHNALCANTGSGPYVGNVLIGYEVACAASTFINWTTAVGYHALKNSGKVQNGVFIGLCAGHCAGAVFSDSDTVVGNCSGMFLGCSGTGSRWNVIIGYFSGNYTATSAVKMLAACCNIIIGNTVCCSGLCNTIILGSGNKSGIGNNTTLVFNCSYLNGHYGTRLCGCLVKGGGSFEIVHPNPAKSKDKVLYHSFVESPTRGDNLYRWSVDVKDCSHSIKLPNYYKHLNENTTIKISSVGHFGKAYGQIDTDQDNLTICTNQDGKYNVLAVATRCDKQALADNFILEKDMNERDINEFVKCCKITIGGTAKGRSWQP